MNSFKNLSCIEIIGNNLFENSAIELAKLLKKCSNLEKIDFTGNRQMNEGFNDILESLCKSKYSLKHLILEDCDVNPFQARSLGDTLKSCMFLETLNLKGNYRMDYGINYIFDSILHLGQYLKTLNLMNCQLNSYQAHKLGNILTNMSNLNTLNLQQNPCLEIGFKDILESFSQCSSKLTILNFDYINLKEKNATLLSNVLVSFVSLQTLNLRGNRQMNEGLNDIFKSLIHVGKTLKCLNLQECSLNPNQAENLAYSIQYLHRFEHLNLKCNETMENGFNSIFRAFESVLNDCSKNFNLEKCNISEEQAISFGNSLKSIKSLEILNLSYNNQTATGMTCILNSIHVFANNLTSLSLENCDLKEYHGFILSNTLKSAYCLRLLNLKGNFNMENGMNEIIKSLSISGNCLEYLNLKKCNLNFSQCEILSNNMTYLKSLDTFNLAGNCNMEKGLNIILKSLYINCRNLKYLNLRNCNIDQHQADMLSLAIKMLRSLETIDINNNDCMNDGLINIFKTLENSGKSITNLNLSNINIQPNQDFQFRKAIELNFYLKKLNISGNNLSENRCSNIFQALTISGNNLVHLNLENCNLNDYSANELSLTIRSLTSLEIIIFNKNKNIRYGWNKLFQALIQSHINLKRLELQDCALNKEGSNYLPCLLRHSSNLQILNLMENNCTDMNFDNILDAINTSGRNLQYLDLQGCNLNHDLAKKLINTIKNLHLLICLNLSENPLVQSDLNEIFNALYLFRDDMKSLTVKGFNTSVPHVLYSSNRRRKMESTNSDGEIKKTRMTNNVYC
ncbi:unnamed protein product [Dimorphilus gyrociliatus]|uniref:Uncharacterized protein n=1 Tax=Dimorphilus gyrociliatus TaxID=2664684 RepID=A0A7I8VCJ2_9ANNE|nr:unnamed protein product [Dimorphilus gyrociliatus]